MSTKTAINFLTEKNLKEEFYSVAKEMHTTPTNILNMLMKNVVITRTIKISLPNKLELEEFNEEEKASFSSDFLKETKKLTKEAETLFSNIK